MGSYRIYLRACPQKQTCAPTKSHVRLTPKATSNAAIWNVRFGSLGHSRTFKRCPLYSRKADIAPSEDLLCATATFLGTAVLRRRTGKVRARIAPATFCQRVRSALFKRAILAVPILAIIYHGAPGRYVGLRRQAEGQMTNSHPD